MSQLAVKICLAFSLRYRTTKVEREWRAVLQKPLYFMWKTFCLQYDSVGIILEENGNNFEPLCSECDKHCAIDCLLSIFT